MLVVASELDTGYVLTPEIGATYCPDNTSETPQTERIIHHLPFDAMVLTDSGFGVFHVA
jgi:hypothetical protein